MRFIDSSGIILSTFLASASMAAAQDADSNQLPDVEENMSIEFDRVNGCTGVLHQPEITDEIRATIQKRWGVEFEDLKQSDKRYVIRRMGLMGREMALPNLETHPLAGRTVSIAIEAWDGIDNKTVSESVECELPTYDFINRLNWEFANIRADIAEFSQKKPDSPEYADMTPSEYFLSVKYPEIEARFDGFMDEASVNIIKDENLEMLRSIEDRFDEPPSMENAGLLIDDLWQLMMALEDDHVTESARKMSEARENFRDMMFGDMDESDMREFMEQAYEAMDKFLEEQIEKAIEDGDEERRKQLEEMREKLEEMREGFEDKENLDREDVHDTYDMMREMMRMQQNQSSPQAMQQMMQNMENMMNNMMNNMMQQLMEQQLRQELQELGEDQNELLDDNTMTEEERQQMLDEVREQMQQIGEQLKERTEGRTEELQDENRDLNIQSRAEEREALEALQEQLEQLGERVQEQADGQQQGEEQRLNGLREQLENNEGLTPDEREAIESEIQERQDALERLEEVEEDVSGAREKLENDSNMTRSEANDFIEEMQRAIGEIERMRRALEDDAMQGSDSGPRQQSDGEQGPEHGKGDNDEGQPHEEGPQEPLSDENEQPQGGQNEGGNEGQQSDGRQSPGQQDVQPQGDEKLQETPRQNMERLEEQLRGLEQQHRDDIDERRERNQELQELRELGEELDETLEQLRREDLTEEELQENMERLGELQDRIAEHEDLDMRALQNGITQLIAQLGDRVDEVGAKEYLKEAAERREGDGAAANEHDENQRFVMALGDEILDILDDIRERMNKNHPMTEDEARATIERLGEIKEELDKLDPPDPDDQNQQQNQQQQNGQQGEQQPQPHELMEMLQELMQNENEQNEQQQNMQQQMQQMMDEAQDLMRRQQQLRERLQEMREQLEQQGLSPEQIDEIMEQMQDAEGQLQQGQPGGAGQPMNRATEGLMQMIQQMPMPGPGPRPGIGPEGPNRIAPPDDIEAIDKGTARDDEIDPNLLDNDAQRIRDMARDKLEDGGLTPEEREYYEGFIRGNNSGTNPGLEP